MAETRVSMVPRIPVAALSIGVLLGPAARTAFPQTPTPARVLASAAATTSGRVQGFVRDASGAAVPGASVLAVGHTVVTARSDLNGRFQMAVPPGEYVLRASRDGYVSTYREPVRILSSVALERVITLIRQGEKVASMTPVDPHSHTELAWRLRHLPASILRDGDDPLAGIASPASISQHGSIFGRAMDSSLRLASRIADTDFTGHVDLMTTTSANSLALLSTTLPRTVAYVVFGAPVGVAGDWRVRGAVGSGTESSWNVLGEYEARQNQAHALRMGMSYSVHGGRLGEFDRSALDSRSATGIFAQDRWHALTDLDVEYSVRADRFDYLTSPNVFSASGGVRLRAMPRLFVTARASQSGLAPGAEEFLPPPADAQWLPPERTFAPLFARDLMRAEYVSHGELVVTREFGSTGVAAAFHVRAFAQQATDQIATLFGVVAGSPGHYYVARAGTVEVSGFAVGVGGHLLPAITGQIEYARMAAIWDHTDRTRGLRHIAPSAIRSDSESLDDVTVSIDASLNDARTRIAVVYRTDSAFSRDANDLEPVAGSRFDIQFHQELPYHPLRDGHIELLFAVRTLLRDPRIGASMYDELLTVAPPLRLMGGLQVRF